jgi:hypothetical protein
MTDSWQAWADAWDAWDAAGADGPILDDFSGYDRWKSDIEPWQSIGDDSRPTRLDALAKLAAELDLTGDEPAAVESEVDLTDDVLNLTDDIEDRAT